DSLGGFEVGTAFTGTGKPGEIMKISPDAQTIVNPWVKLPNEGGHLRGGLHIDRTGVFGGDLIVVSETGGVWRVNSHGQPSILANLHDVLEGPCTVPNDPVRYGPFAGKILAAAENSGRIYAIDPQGNVRFEAVGGSPEGAFVVPAH